MGKCGGVEVSTPWRGAGDQRHPGCLAEQQRVPSQLLHGAANLNLHNALLMCLLHLLPDACIPTTMEYCAAHRALLPQVREGELARAIQVMRARGGAVSRVRAAGTRARRGGRYGRQDELLCWGPLSRVNVAGRAASELGLCRPKMLRKRVRVGSRYGSVRNAKPCVLLHWPGGCLPATRRCSASTSGAWCESAVACWISGVLGAVRMTHPPLHAITARPLARAGHPRTACHVFRSGFRGEGGRQVADNRLSA